MWLGHGIGTETAVNRLSIGTSSSKCIAGVSWTPVDEYVCRYVGGLGMFHTES